MNNTETSQSRSSENKVFYILIFVLSLIALTFGLFFGDGGRNDQADRIEEKVEEIAETLTPFESKNRLSKSVIVENITNTSKDGLPIPLPPKKSLTVSGEVKSGFLYVRASVNGGSLTQYDDIYIKIEGKINGKYVQSGGHLIEKKSLETPKSDNSTELLFDLSDIKYKEEYTDPDYEVFSGNWLEFLNAGNSQLILSFISTEREGKIEELSFYYECETATCSLE